MFTAGVDDAGRGPVIGPMVMAGVKIHKDKEHLFEEMGCKDSKLLTPQKREELFNKITELAAQYHIMTIHPHEIDQALNNPDTNLNSLEADHFAKIINELQPQKAIIDCPSPNIQAYHAEVYSKLDCEPELLCEHKADFSYPVVAAASILAKVTRDRIIAKLKEQHGDFGSGYPSDPKTKAYLQKHWQTNQVIFRTTWASYKRMLDTKKQSSLSDF